MQYKYDSKTHTAYNEAGHTVAYYYFGIPVTSVTIIPDKDGNDGLTTPEEIETTVIKIIMIHFAGPSAELICLGEVRPGALGDIRNACKYNCSETEYFGFKKQIIAILKQPKNHYAVEKLANELLSESFIDGKTAFLIIENAIKEYMSRGGI